MVSRYKIEQRRLTHRGREFHFVSYEGQSANPNRDLPATDATWYLMSGGRRWPVMPHVPGQDPTELDRLFLEWLESHVFD
jgi:hypothetical protein